MRPRFVILLLALLIYSRPAAAQYRIDAWTTEQGLPQGSINAIVQARDGFLWIATYGGLVRFDGTSFRVFDPTNTPELKTSRMDGLYDGADGALWIITDTRDLIRHFNGAFTVFSKANGMLANGFGRIFSSADGTFAGVDTPAGALEWRDGAFVPSNEFPSVKNGITYIGGSTRGAVWYRDRAGAVHRFERGKPLRDVTLPIEIRAFIEDTQGRLWTRVQGNIVSVVGDTVVKYAADRALLPLEEFRMHEDREGTLWFGFSGSSGLLRFMNGVFTRYSVTDGLPHNGVRRIYEDREGTHWVGTQAGLARLTDRAMTPLTIETGLSGDNTYPILQDRRGDIWIGAWPGLTRYHDGKFEAMAERAGVPSGRILSLFEDKAGAIWIGMFGGGVRRFLDGNATPYRGAPGVTRVFIDGPDGDMWLGGPAGLSRFRDDEFHSVTAADGYSGGEVFSMYLDRSGTLWIGNEAGLIRYSGGRYTKIGTPEGFAGRRVRAIHEDRDGTLWFGTYDSGLFRMRDGKFTQYSRKDGLPSNGAFQIIEDDTARFWISSNSGIYRVAKAQLEAFADGRRNDVNAVLYGRSDGMPTQEANGAGQPAGIRARDGRIWIPTQRGVAVFDPSSVPSSVRPPPVVITDLVVGGEVKTERDRIEITSGSTTVEATYAALTFVRPDLARFKYKMEGLDPEWVDAGEQRTARYARLPFGSFRFRVIAANRDGAWNEEGAGVTIEVVRPFYRTTWFSAMIVGAIVLLAAGLTRWRFTLLRRQQEIQEAFSRQLIESQESDRRRIASGLHDGVSQSLYVIKNRAIRANLTEIEASAAQALSEVREVVQDLVPYHLDTLGLAETVREMAGRVGAAAGIATHCHLAELDDRLPLPAQMSLFRIIQEAINNAVKHSNASNLWVEMSIDLDLLHVKIRDDGRGFTASEATPDPSRGGFGVVSMLERARMLGGRMTVNSEPGAGTTIAIEMPIAGGEPS